MNLSSNIVNTMTASDEVNNTATTLNNPLQFKIPGYVLSRNRSTREIITVYDVTDKESFFNVKDWAREISKHVSDGINKLLIESKCDNKLIPSEQGRKLTAHKSFLSRCPCNRLQ